MIKFLYRMTRRNLRSESAYLDWLADSLADCESILELGCGSNSPILKIGAGPRTYAIDIWKPYVDMHNRKRDYYACEECDVFNFSFSPRMFDAVVICDVMEHLPREKALEFDLFGKMERCARKKVIIFAPNGFVENDEVDGDPYQAHVSAWEPEDYRKQGYTVRGATGVRWWLGKAGCIKYKPTIFWDYLNQLTQPFLYYMPELAWHSYARKELNGC